MSIRAATREYRLNEWARIVQECNNSGLTIKEFCESKRISKHAYYYRLKKLREAAYERAEQLQKHPQELSAPTFTEVKLSKSPTLSYETGGKLQVEIGPCKISADSGYPVQSLATLIGELVRS